MEKSKVVGRGKQVPNENHIPLADMSCEDAQAIFVDWQAGVAEEYMQDRGKSDAMVWNRVGRNSHLYHRGVYRTAPEVSELTLYCGVGCYKDGKPSGWGSAVSWQSPKENESLKVVVRFERGIPVSATAEPLPQPPQ